MAPKYSSSGVTIVVFRLLLGVFYLANVIRFRVDVLTDFAFMLHVVLCVLELASTASLLIFPQLTTKGNGYLRCLPFLTISLLASFSSLFVPLGLLEDRIDYIHYLSPEAERVPLIISAFIVALMMYGGIASPLNLSWMLIFKPFQMDFPPEARPRRKSTYRK